MKRILPAMFLFFSTVLFAQDSSLKIIQELVERYGGGQIENGYAQASGTIYYADNSRKAFTLTAKKRFLRMELREADQAMTIVRHGGRSQIAEGEVVEYPNRTPRSGSAINLLPIFALLEFSDDQRFTGSVVRGKDGTAGIAFVEGTPRGMRPPPFPQPKLIATFWFDSGGRISQVVYSEEGGSAGITAYRYSYDVAVPGAFLQPNGITCRIDDKQIWNAIVDGTGKQGSVPEDFFKILETRERIK